MRLKYLLLAILSLFTIGLCSCGNGGEGLNGELTVTATLNGSNIKATATYKNPTRTDLTGTPITFYIQIGGGQRQKLPEVHTNNSGSVGVSIPLDNFNLNGTQTVTVFAETGNLTDFWSVDVTGRSLAVTPPPAPSTALSTVVGTPLPVSLPSFDGFVTVSDPINGNISGHVINITGVSSNSADTVSLVTTSTVTDSSGKAPFPGATIILVSPTAAGIVNRVITWTVTDTSTNLTKTSLTVLTLTAI